MAFQHALSKGFEVVSLRLGPMQLKIKILVYVCCRASSIKLENRSPWVLFPALGRKPAVWHWASHSPFSLRKEQWQTTLKKSCPENFRAVARGQQRWLKAPQKKRSELADYCSKIERGAYLMQQWKAACVATIKESLRCFDHFEVPKSNSLQPRKNGANRTILGSLTSIGKSLLCRMWNVLLFSLFNCSVFFFN